MFEHILVPIDGSPLSALALPIAADLARRYDSTVTLLYVMPPLLVIYDAPAYTSVDSATTVNAKAQGQRILEEARTAMVFPEAQLLYLNDGPSRTAQAIVEVTQQRGVSLVVMGSHGRGGLEHFFLGSVAEGVMRRIGVPVLVVRGPNTSALPLPPMDTPHGALISEVSA
ncbi:universal stress protein [Deinococcus oregonensis]|uniref:Universal stress protein n=1 Tax=Deinococcus oregonensis TaxID=1805970 RepID=A0ABV6ASK2_9DEIO